MTDNHDLKRAISDLSLVARYVSEQPSGYAAFEAQRARLLLDTVDEQALKDTLQSVLFVSNFFRQFGPLTATEAAVQQAALRLERMVRTIQLNKQEIQSRMTA